MNLLIFRPLPHKSKGNIHCNILKETHKMTFNLVIICLFNCISKCIFLNSHCIRKYREAVVISLLLSTHRLSFLLRGTFFFSFCSDVTSNKLMGWQENLLLRFRIQRPYVVYLITFTYRSRLVINDVSPEKNINDWFNILPDLNTDLKRKI